MSTLAPETMPSRCISNSNPRKTETMKKIYIVMAVLATAALASCEQEKSFDEKVFGKNDVVFSIQNGISTRSAEVAPEIRQGVIIPLETEDSEHTFFLEETVMNLDEFVPATKGTPAFTENVGTLYANNLSVYGDKGGFTTAKTFENESGGLLYKQSYDSNPWPASGSVGFYLNMPATPKVTNSFKITGRENGKITFTYTTPDTATNQEDLLFAYRTLTKDEHNAFLKTSPYGAPVLFNHALTAVKFRIGNETKDKVTITEVIFNGLYDGGTCVITPAKENEYTNEKDEDGKLTYSSAAVADWTTVTPTKSGNPISSGKVTGTVDYTGNKFGASWYSDSNSNTQNINDADATHTFWLMPQTMSDKVTLTIKYKINNGAENTWTIAVGQYLKTKGGQYAAWKAGELRTFTIKIDDVNLKIEDTVNNTVKQNVVITNTGNTAAFIRASIVGQWLDSKYRPVFGFTDKDYTYEAVASWYQDQFVSTAVGTHGKFEGLAGYKGGNNPTNDWYLCTDGYYYYKYAVEPGKATGYKNGDNYIQENLFTSYTVLAAPPVSLSGVDVSLRFSLEIATQAVSAMKLDGSTYSGETGWQDAWQNATGTKPTVK